MTLVPNISSTTPRPGTSHASPPPALAQQSVYPPPLTNPAVLGSTKTSTTIPNTKPGSKPVNIFSNDGSFLERFHQLKQEDDVKKKEKEILERKRKFADRFKNRGKRASSSSSGHPSGSSTPSDGAESSEPATKKARTDNSSDKVDQPLNKYQQELKSLNINANLKDAGTGVRPLVK
ncbi:hypothetical protein CC2G_012876 [Coprinopsis cinerea AmutBmut pab1-1]|nr:hypothetical protein CC2G_012876 [Coprinopsis cinerea AmutBmut pab1-1]